MFSSYAWCLYKMKMLGCNSYKMKTLWDFENPGRIRALISPYKPQRWHRESKVWPHLDFRLSAQGTTGNQCCCLCLPNLKYFVMMAPRYLGGIIIKKKSWLYPASRARKTYTFRPGGGIYPGIPCMEENCWTGWHMNRVEFFSSYFSLHSLPPAPAPTFYASSLFHCTLVS